MIGRLVILDDVFEDDDVVPEALLLFMQVGEDALQTFGVVLDFGVEAGFGFVDEMAVVLPLDEAFEAESDQEADGDCQEMKQKVSPAMNRFMGRVYVDHGRDLVEIHWELG